MGSFTKTVSDTSLLKQCAIELIVFFAEAAEGDVEGAAFAGADGDVGGEFGREAVDAGADAGEGDGLDVFLFESEFEAGLVAGGKEVFLSVGVVVPDGAHGVDDVFGGEVESRGDAGLSGRATADGFAGPEQLGAGGTVDGSVDTSASAQAFIGGVYNGVDFELGDVSKYRFHGG